MLNKCQMTGQIDHRLESTRIRTGPKWLPLESELARNLASGLGYNTGSSELIDLRRQIKQ